MQRIPLIIFGAGGVGSALLQQIVDGRSHHAQRNQIHFNVVAVADSKSLLWRADGLSDERLADAIAAKRAGQPLDEELRRLLLADAPETAVPGRQEAQVVRTRQQLADAQRISDLEILAQAEAAGLDEATVVDVTAADGMEPVIDRALEMGCGVVLANKKPLTGPWQTAQRYYNHPRLRHESTVGGGQPIIAALRYLLDTNDPIRRIEGQLSGTLGFICRKLDDGLPFSSALAAARGKGYTEPDPREDLSGKDVMRKIIILGRMAGWPLEPEEIYVESLFPAALAHLPVPEFMAAAVAIDPPMRDRVAAAGAAGEVLRYVAALEDGRGSVSLEPVSVDSPLANLKYVSFHTGRYDDEPLLIGGKGAGVAMTAAGVLGDIIGLARER